ERALPRGHPAQPLELVAVPPGQLELALRGGLAHLRLDSLQHVGVLPGEEAADALDLGGVGRVHFARARRGAAVDGAVEARLAGRPRRTPRVLVALAEAEHAVHELDDLLGRAAAAER